MLAGNAGLQAGCMLMDSASKVPFYGRNFIGGQPVNFIDKLIDVTFLGLNLAINLLNADAHF